MTLRDETRIALGADSTLTLDAFVFDDRAGQPRLLLRIIRGLVAYVSGQIATHAADAVQLHTPEAIIGVRGTTLVIRVDPS